LVIHGATNGEKKKHKKGFNWMWGEPKSPETSASSTAGGREKARLIKKKKERKR